jgi:hypothetical protein
MGMHRFQRLAAGVTLVATGLLSPNAPAETLWYATPSLEAAAVYDDNLFSSVSNRQQDHVLRMSPAIEAGYRSSPSTLHWHYTFDAERYAEHTELDDNRVREHTTLDFSQQHTPALTFGANIGYTRTQTPAELNPETGLDLERARAERFTASPVVTYRFDPLSTGSANYSFTSDELAGGVGNESDLLALDFDRSISRRDTLSIGYEYREFRFDAEDNRSQALLAGGTRRLTSRTSVTLIAGPRFSEDGAIDPEISAQLQHRLQKGDLAFAYIRTETTVIGQSGTVTAESFSADFSYRFGSSLKLHVGPGFFSNRRADLEADVYQLNLDVSYRINRFLSLAGSYHYTKQRGRIDIPGDDQIKRNFFFLGIVIAAPERE